jgi:AcrR family transcriptional regulator
MARKPARAPEEAEPRWRRRKDARPSEIIAAAFKLFAEKGFAAARLDDIAAEAGVSKGALYLYFETKQDIFEAVASEAMGANLDAIEQMARAHQGPSADLIRMIIPRVAELASESSVGKVLKMVIGESGNFPEIARIWHDTIVARGLGILCSIVERGQKSGEFKQGDPRNYAVSIMSPLLVAVIFRETFAPAGARTFDIPALMQQHLDTVLPGLLKSAKP